MLLVAAEPFQDRPRITMSSQLAQTGPFHVRSSMQVWATSDSINALQAFHIMRYINLLLPVLLLL